MADPGPLYRRHRFPAEIIAHAVWLIFRFPLCLRIVEGLPGARGVLVSQGSGFGLRNSGVPSPTRSAAARPVGSATSGTLMRRRFDPWQEALALARCGSGRFRPGSPGAKPPQ